MKVRHLCSSGWFWEGGTLEKPTVKQSVLLGLGLVALMVSGYLVFRSDPSQPRLPGEVDFVCVKSGERFVLDRKAPECKVIPARNPKTSERTLIPCSLKDGKWIVIDHYRSAVTNLAGENRYVDPETLEIRNVPSDQ
ncbi:MAG: hypothetical protein L6Q93_03315 [Phycisphaerae bacterium]|nr:hypothetical protein [Phycisphaerae bacterium]NUQ07564.1 hypothetical protein [Phycisphaerae bacterium]GIK16382.1 MAG: hypothetical protein BroJett003_13460 [Planctomycetota bacterium]